MLERVRVVARVGGDSEDRLGVDRHPRLDAGAGVGGEQLVVVRDDPVVDTDDRAVPHGVVVRGDRRMPLGVVAHVHEQLIRRLGDGDALEQLRRRRALLDDGRVGLLRAAVGVADRIRAALGDRREQRLRSQRPLDARAWTKAVSRDAAHSDRS
jgi:hypothetical protein